jgi:hypothetical protein
MGQITSYTPISAPINVSSMLFIADAGASNQIKSTTLTNLNKVPQIWAADGNGLKLTDDGGNYGLFIKDGGNVGVGTNSPSYELDAQASGDITVRIQSGASNDSVIRFDQSGTQQASIGYDDTGDLLKFNNATNFGGTQHLVINSDGNVGVGTAAPADKVEIKHDNSGTERALQLNFPTASAGVGVKFAEAGTPKAYIQFLGSAYGTVARRSQLEFLSTSGITFWPDSGAADVAIDADGNVGVGTTSPAAKIQIESAGASPELLLLNNTTVDSRLKLTNNGSNPCYIQNAAAYLSIGEGSSPAAATHLIIEKSTGRVNIGGTLGTWNYPLTISSTTATGAEFGCSSSTRSFIYITNTNSAIAQTAVVFGNAETNPRRWMCGQFWNTSHNYFGFEYLGGTTLSGPNDATFNGGTLQDTTVYISQDGGISSQNTATAFGSFKGDGTSDGSSSARSGEYNVASLAVTTGGVATITFTKQMSNTTYTVVATGWDASNSEVIFGEATTKAAGSCVITFRSAGSAPNLQTSFVSGSAGVTWTYQIYGAKLKA